MKFWDILKIANRNLLRNKLRTLLTVAAIFVGSFTLTMTNAIGDGIRSYIDQRIETTEGDGVLRVERSYEREQIGISGDPTEYKDDPTTEPPFEYREMRSSNVTLDQMKDLVSHMPEVKSVTPSYSFYIQYISIDDGKKFNSIMEMLPPGMSKKVEYGESINGLNQLILPLSLAESFAGDKDRVEGLLGKTATIGYKDSNQQMQSLPVRIIGVSTRGFMDMPYSFVDPQTAQTIYTAQQRRSETGGFRDFTVELNSKDAASKEKVRSALQQKGFKANTPAEERKEIYDAINIFKLAMSLIALIALLAASFGIINTLVIAVLERTKEIGLQKALGMGRGKIFAIFSAESVLIGLWGALFGIAGAMILGLSANQLLFSIYGDSMEGYRIFVFTIPSITITVTLVCTIAFLAGVLPAFRASRLNPIESLRHE